MNNNISPVSLKIINVVKKFNDPQINHPIQSPANFFFLGFDFIMYGHDKAIKGIDRFFNQVITCNFKKYFHIH